MKRNKGKQLSMHHSNCNMATKMLLSQQRCYSDSNSKNSFKFSEKSRSIKIVSDLKYQDKKTVSYSDDFTSAEPVEKNVKSLASLNLLDKTVNRPVSREKIGRFGNAKLETRYRTNSTDSAFSEDSFVDLEGDESTKLESLIDQLIFTDDRLNSSMSTYVKTEKQPSMGTGILDVGDLFNNTDIFTVDFESLAHETQTSSFLEREARSDSENTESTSSISSSDSGKDSVHKYPAKMSAFLECNHDKDLNANNNSKNERFTKFSSSLFISSDQDDVNDCDSIGVNKTNVSTIANGTGRSDGCVNDCVHECSFVDLSTLLDVTPYGSPFSVGDNFPIDSQRHLNADDNDVCVIDSNDTKTDCNDTDAHVNTTLHQVTSTKSTISASHAITTKSKNNTNHFENDVPLTDVDFWPMKEEHKMAMYVPSIKNSPVKCMDISEENFNKIVDESMNECDEHSQESLYLCSLENLCGYGDQEMSMINQNNHNCNFLSDTYHEPENRSIFKSNARATDRQTFLTSSDGKSSEIKFQNQKDAKESQDDSKSFSETKLININDSVAHFGDNLDTVKLESYFPDAKDVDAANRSKVRSLSPDVWMLSNDDQIKGMISKDHSYRVHIPANDKEINIPVIDARERNNKTNLTTCIPIKQNPTKRPLVKDLKSEKQELSLLEENLSNRVCSSSNAVFPGLKFLLEEESESVLHRSTNNYYTFEHSEDSGCIQSKVPKFSIIDNDETRVQSAILYQVLSTEQHPPSASFSSTPFLPVKPKVKNHHYNKSSNSRNIKGHYFTNIRQGAISKQAMSMRMKEESSEMKELEKYLRGIIPTENYDELNESYVDHQQKTSDLFFRQDRSPCSFLKKLLTGEMTAQMYRKIDQQFCENEQLIKSEVKMD